MANGTDVCGRRAWGDCGIHPSLSSDRGVTIVSIPHFLKKKNKIKNEQNILRKIKLVKTFNTKLPGKNTGQT